MPSLKLFHRDPDRPSLRQRADALKASAARVMGRERQPRAGTESARPEPATPDRLIAEMLDAWRAIEAIPETEARDGAPDYERALARRYALIDAAEALPADLESVAAKALALAWIESSALWVRGQSRAEYATDGRLALDIHAAIMGAPAESRAIDGDDLVALEAEFRQADREHDAAVAALYGARDRYVGPPMPKELRVWRFDWIHAAIPRPRIVTTEGGTRTLPYGEEEVEQMRGLRCVRPSYGSAGEMGPDGVRVVPDTQVQERVDGIVAAWDRWQAEIRAAEAALEIPGLRADRDAAEDRRIALLERVRETPARTLAGLGAKARVAATVIGVEDVGAEGRDAFTADDPAALPYELVADLLALTGTAGA